MKTVVHKKRLSDGHDAFSVTTFFAVAILISVVLATIVVAALGNFGIGAELLDHRTAIILACLLVGLVSSSYISDRSQS